MSDTNDAGDFARPGPGHNQPPLETPDEIAERLGLAYLSLIGRRDELADMATRLPAADKMDSEWEKKLSDGIKAAQTFLKSAEARRVDEKEPFLAAERAVDGFFATVKDPITKLKDTMGALLSSYQRAEARRKADELAAEQRRAREAQEAAEAERRKAEAAARKKQLDAQAAADAADRLRRAKEAEAKAADDLAVAARAAKAKPAALSRSRTDLGVVASLRTVWDHEIVDADKVPRAYCSPDKAKIKAAIGSNTDDNDGKCTLKIAGVSIFPKSDSVVR